LRALAARIEAQHRQLAFVVGEPEDRLQRGGLAGAVRPDQADDATRFDLEVDAVERLDAAVALGQAAGTDHGLQGTHRLSS
jgi:hypothetical protein